MSRRGTARALTPYLVRLPLVRVMAVLGVGLVCWLAFFGSASQMPIRLRVAGALLAIAAAWVVDDAAGVTVGASPTSLALRRLLRAAWPLGLVAFAWVAACVVAQHRNTGLAVLPATVEVAGLGAIALAVVALQARREPGERCGHFGVIALLAFLFAIHFLPRWFSLIPDEPIQLADAVHLRWLGVFTIAVAVILASVRDPSRRRLLAVG